MPVRGSPQGLLALGVALAAVLTAAAVVVLAVPSRPVSRALPQLTAAPAPAGWARLALPGGTAVLSYPPSLHPVAGDQGSVSAARLSPVGRYLLYLNATPREGTENLRHWAAIRLGLLRSDDAASARQDAAATGVRFRGGTGSCVNDNYVTKIGAHHYEEIACLVQGRSSASVIVAAAPAAQWSRAGPLLERAVAAYQVR